MTKDHMISFRYGEDERRSIETIIQYIREAAPGTDPNISDAIRFAVITAAGDIRIEKNQESNEMNEYYILHRLSGDGEDEYQTVSCTEGNNPLYGYGSWDLLEGPFKSWEEADEWYDTPIEAPK